MFTAGRTLARAAFAVIAISITALAVSAQNSRGPESGRGAFQIGYLNLDLAGINKALVAAALPRVGEEFATLGGMGFAERGRWLIGGEGQGIVGAQKTSADGSFEVDLNGGYGLFRLGYKVLNKRRADLYPMLGIGGGGLQLDIKGRSAPTFEDVLENPARSSRLTTGGLMLDLGIGASYRVTRSERKDRGVGGFMIGATAGYVFTPATSAWKLDELNSVAGGPDGKIQGFYVRISIGGWGRRPAAAE